MFLSSLLSFKSIASLLVLAISIGIGSFLYLTLDPDFEAEPHMMLSRSTGSDSLKSKTPFEDINQVINIARQAWSIVDKK
jgi:hypothetical protein